MKIEMKDVSFAYGVGKDPVIHDVNLCIDTPGLYCIVGPNGVGKSTLIKCMNKIFKPTAGEVYLDGKNLSDMSLKEIAEHIGYVPVQTMDVFSIPVVDAILMGRQNRSRWRTSSEDLQIAARAMKMLGIEDLSMRGFNELSAGQHQKVALARGVVQQTEILLLDEPTANLDVKHQVYVAELLRGLAIQNDIIVIMISHDLNISSKYANNIIVMEGGTVVQIGPPSEVITEALVNRVYNVECRIVDDGGVPHVILGSALSLS